MSWQDPTAPIWIWFGALAVFLLVARLCHLGVLWVDEAYGMAAAQALWGGKALYRDIWFDKPPLYAWFYLLAPQPGIALRVLDAAFSLLCCWLSWGVARSLFREWEGRMASLLMALFLVFGIPSAVVSVAPDMLTIPFALGMAWKAARSRYFAAGAFAGLALLANGKALYLLPVVCLWTFLRDPLSLPRTVGGYLVGLVGALAPVAILGGLPGYWAQVWEWGAVYSRDTFVTNPVREGLLRTANWAGFHAALVLPAVWFLWVQRRVRGDRRSTVLAAWLVLALLSVAGGLRFFPRYYFALLPVAVVLAAAGLRLMPTRLRIVLLMATLAIPVIRFGKPQVQIAWETMTTGTTTNRDLALWRDAVDAAGGIRPAIATEPGSHPADTMLVWGYRPEMTVLLGMPPATRFLDSQPLTGVIADRHLSSSQVSYPELAKANRLELLRNRPTWIADGLGPLNPELGIEQYPELRDWLGQYEIAFQNQSFRIYRRK